MSDGAEEQSDIVDRLLRWVDREAEEDDPAGAITAAAAEIVKLRHDIMELASAVRTAESKKDAVDVANRVSPLNEIAVLRNGFHRVDMGFRNITRHGSKQQEGGR